MVKNVFLFLTLFFLLISPQAQAENSEKVVLQLKWIHAFQFAGYYAAKEQGYYQQAGLDVEIRPAHPETDVVAAVTSGEAQYGVGMSSLLLSYHNQSPVVVLATIFQHSPLIILTKQTSITQGLHDLVGKSLMVERQSDELTAYLKLEGITPSQLRIIEHSFNPLDLKHDHIDAITAYATNEPFFLREAGIPYNAYTPRSAGIDFYGDNLFTTKQEIADNPERVKAFRQASLEGWKYAMAHPKEIIELILRDYPTTYSRDFLTFESQEMVKLLQPNLVEMGYMNPGRWRHIANTYADLNMLPKDISLDGFIYQTKPKSYSEFLFGSLAIAIVLLLIVSYITLYIYRTNRRLDLALSESENNQRVIWHQANIDPLTNLPNKRLLIDRIKQQIKKSKRDKQRFGLLHIDLDHFKLINDSRGHHIGDVLLKQVALRLENTVRSTDTVARLDGDSFALILSEIADRTSVDNIANNILQLIKEPFDVGGQSYYLTVSIGIVIYPDDSKSVKTLIQNLNQAMYHAKRTGRDCFHYYTESMHQLAVERMDLANDLRQAINHDEFFLVYQPIVELTSKKTIKAEALVRWRHPQKGLVMPNDFITIAEETGTITELGDWIFDTAVTQLKQWQNRYSPDFAMNINSSPRQYQKNGDFIQGWLNTLERLSINNETVTIEITESLLMKNKSQVSEHLKLFSNNGVKLALDDFGTGYSSLAYIKNFKLDYVKIDREFVKNITENRDDLVLCEVIIIMAHQLGLKVVAEGIETQEQCDLLLKVGCDYGQGYLFSKPLDTDSFEQLMAQSYQHVTT